MRVKYLRDYNGVVRAAIGTELVADNVLNCAACVVSDQDTFDKKTARSILKSRLSACTVNGVHLERPFKKYESRDGVPGNIIVNILRDSYISMVSGAMDKNIFIDRIRSASRYISELKYSGTDFQKGYTDFV